MKLKKKLIPMLVITLLSGMMGACQGTGAATATTTAATTAKAAAAEQTTAATTAATEAAKENVELRFSWWGGDARAEATLKVIDQFQTLNPHIVIKPEYGGSEGYNDKLSTQLSAGTAPDVIQLANNMPAYYKQQGADYLVDLREAGFDFSKFDKDYLDMRINGNIDGVQVGVPTGVAGAAFLINQTLADQMGVDLKGAKTWNDLIEAGKAVHAKSPDTFLISTNTTYLVTLFFRPYFTQITGKSFYDEASAQTIMNKENLTQAFQLIKDMYDNKVIAPASYTAAYAGDKLQTDPNWIAGKYVATPTYISTIEVMTAANTNTQYAVGGLPVMDNALIDGYLTNCPQVMVVNKKSPHVAESVQFLNYFFNDPASMETLGSVRSVPPTAEARKLLADKKLMNPLVQEAADISITYKGLILDQFTDTQEGMAIFEQAVEAIGYGASTPEKAAEDVLSLFENIIK